MSEPRLLTAEALADASPQELRAHIAALELKVAWLEHEVRDSTGVSRPAVAFLAAAENFLDLPLLVSEEGLPGGAWEWRFMRVLTTLNTAPKRVTRKLDEKIAALEAANAGLLEEHRKALVRARNEGIERVARMFDGRAASLRSYKEHASGERERVERAEEAELMARDIRDMMEPEP